MCLVCVILFDVILMQSMFYQKSLSQSCLRGRTFYYNTLKGFGSAMDCKEPFVREYLCPGPQMSVFCDDFCWKWNTQKYWGGIDSTEANSHMTFDSLFIWPSTFFMVFMAVSCSFISALFFCLMICKSHSRTINLARMNHRVLIGHKK